ncbi:hypothetical protein CL622_01645 [archaeon]|nr:hypothetical protein [archaeon]
MPNENGSTGKLKLVHLVYMLGAAILLVGIAWGTMRNQQATNTKEIEKKVEKEIFNMHQQEQTRQVDSIITTMNNGFNKIDTRLENIEKAK